MDSEDKDVQAIGSQGKKEAGGSADKFGAEEKKYLFLGVLPAELRPKVTVDEMYEVARTFAEKVFTNEAIISRIKTTGMILRMEYFDPENWGDVEPQVTIDVSKDPVELHTGPCEVAPIVTLRMHADIAHHFWMQKLNMIKAITRRQIIAKGPIPQLMRLLVMLKPCFPIYKETLRELNRIDLLNFPPDDAPNKDEIPV